MRPFIRTLASQHNRLFIASTLSLRPSHLTSCAFFAFLRCFLRHFSCFPRHSSISPMSPPATPVDGIDLPPASIQDESTSPTNDPLIPKHLEMSAKKRNATPFTIKASSTMLTNVKAKMPSFIRELEEVNEQLGKSSIHKSSPNTIMTAVATMKLQAFTKDSAKVSTKDIQTIHDCNTKPVSTIISTPDSLLDALTELLMRSTVPGCSWQSVTRLICMNPDGSVEKINILTQYNRLNKWALLSSASLMWVAPNAEILAQDGLSVEFSHLVLLQLLLNSCSSNLRDKITANIDQPAVINDGLYVMFLLFNHFFPSYVSYQQAVVACIKRISLAKLEYDVSLFNASIKKYHQLCKLDASQQFKILHHYITKMMTHPLNMMKSHFQKVLMELFTTQMVNIHTIGLQDLINISNSMHALIMNPALDLFKHVVPPSQQKNDQQELIITMQGQIHNLVKHQKHLIGYMASMSQCNKEHANVTCELKMEVIKKRKHNFEKPSWFTMKLTNLTEAKEFNNATWHWCNKYGNWSTSHTKNGIPSLGIKAHSSPKKSRKSKNVMFQLAKKLKANLTALNSLKADTKKLESCTKGLAACIKQAGGIGN